MQAGKILIVRSKNDTEIKNSLHYESISGEYWKVRPPGTKNLGLYIFNTLQAFTGWVVMGGGRECVLLVHHHNSTILYLNDAKFS